MTKNNDMSWQKDGVCARPENKGKETFFFSSKTDEKYQAKNMCFSCPVRRDCVKFALETKQIWGIWGGKDEGEIRRTLSVSWNGQESRRQRPPQCPYCNARTSKLQTIVADVPGGGRWTTMKLVNCTECDFTWRSRTSANAVETYHIQRSEKLAKSEEEKKAKKPKALPE